MSAEKRSISAPADLFARADVRRKELGYDKFSDYIQHLIRADVMHGGAHIREASPDYQVSSSPGLTAAGKILGGHVYFKGKDLVRATDAEIRKIRGAEIGVIFQEPMAALNPVHRIGRQVSEVFRIHQKISKIDAWAAATDRLPSRATASISVVTGLSWV